MGSSGLFLMKNQQSEDLRQDHIVHIYMDCGLMYTVHSVSRVRLGRHEFLHIVLMPFL